MLEAQSDRPLRRSQIRACCDLSLDAAGRSEPGSGKHARTLRGIAGGDQAKLVGALPAQHKVGGAGLGPNPTQISTVVFLVDLPA